MKHLALILLLCGATSFAQNGFIEVTVTDTVWMKPASFDYNITVKENWALYPDDIDVNFNEEQVMAAMEADRKQKMEVLKDFLTKKNMPLQRLKARSTAC